MQIVCSFQSMTDYGSTSSSRGDSSSHEGLSFSVGGTGTSGTTTSAVCTGGVSRVAFGVGSSQLCVMSADPSCLLSESPHMHKIAAEFANIYTVRCNHQSATATSSSVSANQKDTALKFRHHHQPMMTVQSKNFSPKS